MAEQSKTCTDLWLLDSLEDFQSYSLKLIQGTSRRLCILSQDLDAPVFARADIVSAISEFARSSRYVQIQILVRNTKPAKEIAHPLIKLSQRISSKIEIRNITVEPEHNQREFILGDTDGLLYKNDFSTYKGFANFAAMQEVKHFHNEFTYLWEYGIIEQDFKTIFI